MRLQGPSCSLGRALRFAILGISERGEAGKAFVSFTVVAVVAVAVVAVVGWVVVELGGGG
jgi:hypothetical protein